jgi:hypothetical protein
MTRLLGSDSGVGGAAEARPTMPSWVEAPWAVQTTRLPRTLQPPVPGSRSTPGDTRETLGWKWAWLGSNQRLLSCESESGSLLACVHQERTRFILQEDGPQETVVVRCAPLTRGPNMVRRRSDVRSRPVPDHAIVGGHEPDARSERLAGIRPPGVQAAVSLPPVTPGGRPVEITEEQHDGAHRVHLTAREGGEIYLEFFRFLDLQPPDEYAGHRAYLVGRFGPEAVSQLTETACGDGLPGPMRFAGTGSNERCCRCRWAATPTGSSPTPELG